MVYVGAGALLVTVAEGGSGMGMDCAATWLARRTRTKGSQRDGRDNRERDFIFFRKHSDSRG
jgi:hypothetical protein